MTTQIAPLNPPESATTSAYPTGTYFWRSYRVVLTAGQQQVVFLPYQNDQKGITVISSNMANTQIDCSVSPWSMINNDYLNNTTNAIWASTINSGSADPFVFSGGLQAVRITNTGGSGTITVEVLAG